MPHGASDQRFASEREQELVRSHARRRPGSEHDSGDHHGDFMQECRFPAG